MKLGLVDMHDNIGKLQQVPGFATYSEYNALGQIGSVTYDNGVATTYSYYSSSDHPEWLNRLKSIKTGPSYSLQNLTYTYYNNGNIYTITDANDANRSQTFTYDHLDRLTQAQSSVYSTITYSYDQIGNMTYNSQVGNYYYNSSRPHAVYQAGSNTYGYDNNGNMITAPGKTITYDYDNRPSSINSTTFVYDYSGHRLKKNSTIYIGKLYECTGSACTKYIFAGSNRIALKTSTTTYYYHTDHLGSSSVMTDAYGTSQGNYHYYPYGATRISSGLSIKHKYTGQELDSETGLYNYGARYYDPALGRFVSADSIVQDYTDPQTLNRYSYCRNNPIILTDPSGHLFGIDDLTIGILIASMAKGAVIGSAIGAGVSAATGGDIGKGALTGAIGGAIFGGAGAIVHGMEAAPGGISSITKAGIHAVAGATSGGINAGVTGSNVGIGMLTGGLAAGISAYAGAEVFPKNDAVQVGGRVLLVGTIGGAISEMSGGDFGQGFIVGGSTALLGELLNDMSSDKNKQQQSNNDSNIFGRWSKSWEFDGQKFSRGIPYALMVVQGTGEAILSGALFLEASVEAGATPSTGGLTAFKAVHSAVSGLTHATAAGSLLYYGGKGVWNTWFDYVPFPTNK
jgi:RHS repeat-associated protein